MVAHAASDPHSVPGLPDGNAAPDSYLAYVDTASDPHTMRRLSHSYPSAAAYMVAYPATYAYTMPGLPDSNASADSDLAYVDAPPYAYSMRRLPDAHAPAAAYMVAHAASDPHSVRRLPHTHTSTVYVVYPSPDTHNVTG
jgi:hypothetical protein